MQDNDNNLYSERNFFTQVEQVVRKLNARADRIFLLDVAFFHVGEHKKFRPVALLPKMEIANPPFFMSAIRSFFRYSRSFFRSSGDVFMA